MSRAAVQQPVAAATVSLLVFAACVGAFMPPFFARTSGSVWLMVVLGLAIGVSFILHVAFVCIAARRAGRSALGWGVLTVLLFPVASIAGLILFEWFSQEGDDAALQKGSA